MNQDVTKLLEGKPRASWEADLQRLAGMSLRLDSSHHQLTDSLAAMYEDRMLYIQNILDKHYTYTCLVCHESVPIPYHDTVVKTCLGCLRNSILKVINEMTDEERAELDERLDKQLI